MNPEQRAAAGDNYQSNTSLHYHQQPHSSTEKPAALKAVRNIDLMYSENRNDVSFSLSSGLRLIVFHAWLMLMQRSQFERAGQSGRDSKKRREANKMLTSDICGVKRCRSLWSGEAHNKILNASLAVTFNDYNTL